MSTLIQCTLFLAAYVAAPGLLGIILPRWAPDFSGRPGSGSCMVPVVLMAIPVIVGICEWRGVVNVIVLTFAALIGLAIGMRLPSWIGRLMQARKRVSALEA